MNLSPQSLKSPSAIPPLMPEHPGRLDVPDPGTFEILKAAESGSLPEEVQRGLQDLADAIAGALGDEPSGVVGLRFGRRVIVAPADKPTDAVDIADVDLARKIILTVGGRDPGPSGSLLAQVLFQRTDAVVGYAEAQDLPGPTMDAMKQILVPLQASPATRTQGVGTVALGKQPSDLGASLKQLDDEDDGTDQGDDDIKPDPGVNTV